MKKKRGSKKQLNNYIEDVKVRQKNLIWPDVLRGGRSVDELLWKGARDAPLVQRIGVIVLALAYVLIGLVFVLIAFEQGEWLTGAFAGFLFVAAGWFIRNALRR